MNRRIINPILLITFLVCVSCEEVVEKEKPQKSTRESTVVLTQNQNLNISFLLDLSDRINPDKYPNLTMDYYKMDVAYIQSVSEAFLAHLKNKKVQRMNDRIQLYFDPPPRNQNINNLSKSLRYEINRRNISEDLLEAIKHSYETKPLEIYKQAIDDNAYIGSDMWRFFKNKIHDFCILKEHRNILIILTDGYIYHKDTQMKEGNQTTYLTPQFIRKHKLNTKNWKQRIVDKNFGFIPAAENLENLEVLVLGINPDKKNPYEEDVIEEYWKDWLHDMKVGKYKIKTAILPSNMDKIIKDFILN
ncbi:hypothetical protein C8N46_112121 [Kordia periserrulae]|uniref:VWFA domain-containing protein n=1 Tax=Kordia periserrulae TaxID=701523 RepID=A0A2T6BRU0_9FLAO|nr:hypothetical protein [Kordia periserrulae]PTX58813.1 hypothetical protein C8N46_112121 [Kordia periserrulae]